VPELLRLEDNRHRVTIAPTVGGGLAGFEALTPGGPVSVFRPQQGPAGGSALALNLLLPFSNRISGGGFTYNGNFYPVPTNIAGEPLPLHGDGWQRSWKVCEADSRAAVLRLDAGGIGPFRYSAEASYWLDNAGLAIMLEITNTGAELPFGGGFHPWLPRYADTTLEFAAEGVWLEDASHLPDRHLPLVTLPELDFGVPRPLPAQWINNAFTGWNGGARARQPTLGITVDITAMPPLDVAIIYSPGETAAFFCFEPVSHAVDAHNQPGQPGLAVLQSGERLRLGMRASWSPLAATAPER
jgi:aldose 1-epimerase